MNAIARDLGKLRHATRDAELDDREALWLEHTAARRDVFDVELLCSILEKVREAGFLQAMLSKPRQTERDQHVAPQPWGEAGRGPGA